MSLLFLVLAITLRITSNSFLNAFQKDLSKTNHPLNTNFKTYLLLFVFCLPLLAIFYFKTLTFKIFIWALIGGLFGAMGNGFLITALKYGELSVLAPINSYKAIVGLIFGIIILKEVPNFSAILGIILIISGSFIIFETQKEGFSFKLFKRKDVVYRFLALIFSAIEAVFIKKVIILTDVYCSFYLWVIFGFIFSYVLLKINKTAAFKSFNFKKEIQPFIPLCFLVFLMQFSTNIVFEKVSVAIALSLFQLSNIVSIFLGCKFFKEKGILKKLIGSIIMILGSVVVLFSR